MFDRSELARALLTVGPWEWQKGGCICEIFHLCKGELFLSCQAKCRAGGNNKSQKR